MISEVLKQEVPGLFAPQLGINFTHTQTSSYSESLGGGHILAGSADFKVQDTIKFKGAPVQVLTELFVDCKTLVIEGEQLHSTVDQKRRM